jgi:AraC family transcriptional regulator of arabinose operon
MTAMPENLSGITPGALPERVFFGEVVYEPGGAFGPRIQPDVQFVIIHRGSAAINVNGEDRPLPVDHVSCMHPGWRESYRFDAQRPTHHTWVALHYGQVGRTLRATLGALPFCLPLMRPMRGILELGLALQRTRSRRNDPVMIHLGAAFFQAYAQAAAGMTDERPVPEPIVRARRYVQERFRDELDLAAIAKAGGVSTNHIVRLFRQHLGVTPIRYLWQVRVERGAELLRDTGLSISEVAYQVGFTTPYHFSRMVKQQLGMPPKQLRQTYWQRT